MSTHPIDPPVPDPSAPARIALIEAITETRSMPVHESAIYTFEPYVQWLRAVSPSPSMRAFHLRCAAERLAYGLYHDGNRKDLKELALFVVNLAFDCPNEPTP